MDDSARLDAGAQAEGLPLDLAVIGVGGMANWQHLPNLAAMGDRARIAALVDPDGDRLATAAARYHVARTYASVDQLLRSGPALDGALVLTRPPDHAGPVIDLLQAGVPVFCEKPLAYRLDEAEAMVEASRRTGVTLMVGYNRRFAATVRAAKDTVSRAGPQLVLAEKSKPNPPEARVRLLEFAVHALDTLVWLAGGEVESLQVQSRLEAGGSTEETLAALMRFTTGAIGVFTTNTHGGHWVERYEAYSGDATVIVEYPVRIRRLTREPLSLTPDLAALLAAPPPDREVGDIDGEPLLQLAGSLCPVDVPAALGFRAELEHFVECIRGGSRPLTAGESALATERLAHRIYREAGVRL